MISNFFIKVITKLRILPRGYLTGRLKLNGKKIKIPVQGKVGLVNLKNKEPWMVDLMVLLKPNMKNKSFIDIGVNLGQTLMKIKSVFPEISYVGFEPNPVCVNYVKQLVDINDYQDVEVVPAGLSDSGGLVRFNFMLESASDPAATIMSDLRPPDQVLRQEYVSVISFEDFEKINGEVTPDIIKIDVEGAELPVLKSLTSLINRVRPIIICEILPIYSSDNTQRIERQKEIVSLLKGMDYCIIRIMKDEQRKLKGFQQIDSFGIHDDLDLADYVFCPDGLQTVFLKN